jgi:hypothetical protein
LLSLTAAEHEGEAGYTTACEATKRSIFGDYLSAEFEACGVTRTQIAELFPSGGGIDFMRLKLGDGLQLPDA